MQTHKPAGALAIKPAYGNCKVANGSTSPSTKKKKKTSVQKFTLARAHSNAGTNNVCTNSQCWAHRIYMAVHLRMCCVRRSVRRCCVSAAPGAFHSTKVAE